jgi:hypothetical protein
MGPSMGVVLISSPHSIPWYRQFPAGLPIWKDLKFAFNSSNRERYDYLVAFDDLAEPTEPRCPIENTIHVATEPPSYHRYDPRFTQQFGMCLTFEPEPDHPCAIRSQPGLNWWIGWNSAQGGAPGAMSFRELEAVFDEPRDKLISVIASNKKIIAGHKQRLNFAMRLRQYFGSRIDLFGRGFAHLPDKLDALRRYRFHIAIENANFSHYFTEKISDCLIAGCYPIYYGCPNISDYIPEDSFSRIDIHDFDGAVALIEEAISQDLDRKRRDALREARHRIMYEHNLFPLLARIIAAHRRGDYGRTKPKIRYGRELLPYGHPRFRDVCRPVEAPTHAHRFNSITDRYRIVGFVRDAYRNATKRPG